MPDSDAKQPGAPHRDQARDKDRGKPVVRVRYCEQNPQREERQPCRENDRAAIDELSGHWVKLSQLLSDADKPLTD
jgi:hypothetical protein